MNKPKRSIMMDLDPMEDAVYLASLGVSTQEISRRTGLSNGQVYYRLRTHKEVTGLEQGLRSQWREGNSPLLERMLQDCQGVMRLEWERKFLPRIIPVTAQPVKVPVERKR